MNALKLDRELHEKIKGADKLSHRELNELRQKLRKQHAQLTKSAYLRDELAFSELYHGVEAPLTNATEPRERRALRYVVTKWMDELDGMDLGFPH